MSPQDEILMFAPHEQVEFARVQTGDATAYRFFFVQALMRSSAFSIFSIEFATLKRR